MQKGKKFVTYALIYIWNYRRSRGKETLPATFLLNSFLSKLAPLTNYITDSDAELNDETESVMKFVRGSSFDKKEFKRNVAGSVSYAPASTVLWSYIKKVSTGMVISR